MDAVKEKTKWGAFWDKYNLHFWTSVWILAGLSAGLLIVWFTASPYSIAVGVVFIWALAFFLTGALVGCIFGVPKMVTNTPKIPLDNHNPPKSEAKSDKTPALMNKGKTNLTDISEWLTKIVIGAGLVQLKDLPHFILKVADRISKGIDLTPAYHSNILCAGILLYYTSFGLIAGYFVMRAIFLGVIE